MANPNQSKKTSFNPFENTSSMPNFMDFGNIRQQYSKNVEALAAANQVALDFSKEAARRASELVEKNAQCIYDCSKDAMESKSLDEARRKQANMIASVMDNTLSQAKESAEISSKATREILDMYNKRISEVLECCNK